MRIRTLAVIALMAIPVALSAQRMPRGAGAKRPGRAEMPEKQPRVVGQALAYTRSRVSFDAYPMISYFRAPGMLTPGHLASWTSGGMASHVDYRIKPRVSASLDMMSTIIGGTPLTASVELGTRFKRNDWAFANRVNPFLDLRGGFTYAYNTYTAPASIVAPGPSSSFSSGGRYSQGFGASVGAGIETFLTQNWSLLTAGGLARYQMKTYKVSNGPMMPDGSFPLTSLRLMIGLRYNAVTMISQLANTPQPQ